jgi:hypothetical protein
MLSDNFVRRLALIKYFFSIGIEQSRRPEPFCVFSILTFHDAIELFLQLSSEYLNAGKSGESQIKFLEYWDVLSRKLPENGITQKESMKRLNSARVALKHHGTIPAKGEIEIFRSNVSDFFMENISIVFGIDFADISLTDLVQLKSARDNLKEAEALLKQGKVEESIGKVAIAFHQLISDYETRKISEFGRSPFWFGSDMTFLSSFFMGIDSFRDKMGRFVDDVKESIVAIQGAVKVMSLGIDYRRYARFKLLTPIVNESPDGSPTIWKSPSESTHILNAEDAQFCIDFVIESSVRLQEFDYTLET